MGSYGARWKRGSGLGWVAMRRRRSKRRSVLGGVSLRAGRLETRVGGTGTAERVLDPLQGHRVVDDPEVLREVERTAVLEEHIGGPPAGLQERRRVRGDDLVVRGLDLGVGDEAGGFVAGVQMAQEGGAGNLLRARRA